MAEKSARVSRETRAVVCGDQHGERGGEKHNSNRLLFACCLSATDTSLLRDETFGFAQEFFLSAPKCSPSSRCGTLCQNPLMLWERSLSETTVLTPAIIRDMKLQSILLGGRGFLTKPCVSPQVFHGSMRRVGCGRVVTTARGVKPSRNVSNLVASNRERARIGGHGQTN
jgi:hypothetical protein